MVRRARDCGAGRLYALLLRLVLRLFVCGPVCHAEDLDASDSDLDSSSSDDDDIDRVARMRQRRNATAHLRTVDVDALLPNASGTGATESKQDDWTAPELAPILACRFRLLLVQEVVYNSIPFGQRIHLHTLVARALESKLKEAQVEAAAIVNRVRTFPRWLQLGCVVLNVTLGAGCRFANAASPTRAHTTTPRPRLYTFGLTFPTATKKRSFPWRIC